MNNLLSSEIESSTQRVNKRSDRIMAICLFAYFVAGLLFAFVYDTWVVAIGIGGLSLAAYYSARWLLPKSKLYQYVLSLVIGIFMAQFIFQMHGLFEMHFFAFIGSALLITYQNWRLQLPLAIFVFLHHTIFAILQDAGYTNIHFTQLGYFDWQTFVIHILLTIAVFFICGLWAFQLKKANEMQIAQSLEVTDLRKETQLAAERSKLLDICWMQSHNVRDPLCRAMSLIPMIREAYNNNEDIEQLLHYLTKSTQEIDQAIHDITKRSLPEPADS